MGKSRRGRDQQIYGVFGGYSDDDDDSHTGLGGHRGSKYEHKKRRRRKEDSDSSDDIQISFVKGGYLQPPTPEELDREKLSKKKTTVKFRTRERAADPFGSTKGVKLNIQKKVDVPVSKNVLGLDYSETDEEEENKVHSGGDKKANEGDDDVDERTIENGGSLSDGVESQVPLTSSGDSSDDDEEDIEKEKDDNMVFKEPHGFEFKDARLKLEAKANEDGAAGKSKSVNSWGFNKMHKTYGKGFDLLKRMGYTGGGLGKDGMGLANPIEVKVRTKNRGLQDSGEKHLEGNKVSGVDGVEFSKVSAEGNKSALEIMFKWKRDAEDLEDGGVARLSGMSTDWKKTSEGSGKNRVVKGAREIAAEARLKEQERQQRQERQKQQLRIIDMTGPEVRVLNSTNDIHEALLKQQEAIGDDFISLNTGGGDTDNLKEDPPLLPLQRALRQLVRRVEGQLTHIVTMKQQQEDQLLALAKDNTSVAESEYKQPSISGLRIYKKIKELHKSIFKEDKEKKGLSESTEGTQMRRSRSSSLSSEGNRWSDDEGSVMDLSDRNSSSNEDNTVCNVDGKEIRMVVRGVNRLRSKLSSLLRDSPKEYFFFHGMAIGCVLLRLLLSRGLKFWRPIQQHKEGCELAKAIGGWKEFLQTQGQQCTSYRCFPIFGPVVGNIWEGISIDCDLILTLLDECTENTVGTTLRRFIVNDWNPSQDNDAVLLQIQAWKDIGVDEGKSWVSRILNGPILQTFFKTIQTWKWNKSTDANAMDRKGIVDENVMPMHLWLQLWLPVLPHLAVQQVLMQLQLSLCTYLEVQWKPDDRTGRAHLLPWKDVFDNLQWLSLLQRAVVPKLHDHLAAMPVRPDCQDLTPVRDVLYWEALLSTDMLANIFLSAFFPQWLQVLRVWITSPGADFGEVRQWYSGWKSVFPASMIAHHRVELVLMEALRLMGAAASGKELPPTSKSSVNAYGKMPLGVIPPFAPDMYPVSPYASSPAMATQMPMAPPPPTPEEAVKRTTTLVEVMEGIAAEKGLLWKPKPGRIERGRQVYAFGRANVFADDDVIYTKGFSNKTEWKPMTLDDVVKLAEKQR